MRKRIFEVIEVSQDGDRLSAFYDSLMLLVISLSLLPLMFKESYPVLVAIDRAAVVIFIADYLLRWATADYKYGRHTVFSFLRYPFSLMAIIDLLSILPSLTFLNASFKVLRVLRLMRALRVFRVLRAVRYSKSIRIIGAVLRHYEEYYDIFMQKKDMTDLLEIYNRRLANNGAPVRVLDPAGEYTGTALGINHRGELLVETETGEVRNVLSGEVSVRGIYGYV